MGSLQITSKVSIGPYHTNTGANAFVAGFQNSVTGDYSSVGGGATNSANGTGATIGGGGTSDGFSFLSNEAGGGGATISGGFGNRANNTADAVGGGQENTANGGASTIGGGARNTASGNGATIGGGAFNTASGASSTVPGGWSNGATGRFSFAAGRFAQANHDGTFIWADSAVANLFSTGPNQFLIRASGGVGIGTNSPGAALDVLGNVRAGSSQNTLMGTHPNYNNGYAGWWKDGSDYSMLSDGTNTYLNAPLTTGGIYFRSNNADKMVVQGSTGYVGIGTTAPDQLLSVNGNASKSGGGTWAVFSDRRLKTDINPFRDGLSVIKRVNPVTFRYNGKRGLPTDKTYVGVIAQEIKDVVPYTVDSFKGKLDPQDSEETDILRFDANALMYISINAIKELSAENQKLRQELDELKAMVKSLAAERNGVGNKSMGELK
ncbi:MAG: tail fiber domain-containing protein [Ignavibacteria bacterium]|nr:tail fiber domain-containing protein [Ignavibacteria bacterium]